MAFGVNGSGDYMRRTASLPAYNGYTVCGWAKRRTLRASTWQYFCTVEDAAANSTYYNLLGWNNAGQMALTTTNTEATFGADVSNDQWFFFALKSDGTTIYARRAVSGDVALTGISTAAFGFTTGALILGNDSYDEYCDIVLAYVRVWDAVLSDSELLSEMASTTWVRTTNRNCGVDGSAGTDTGPNARNWTVGGTLTGETDPTLGGGGTTDPIAAWFRRRPAMMIDSWR